MTCATPDWVEWNGVQLMWDYYGAHPFGYWATLDETKEYKMCYGKEQTTHKEASSRFFAQCLNELLDEMDYERSNELEYLLEEYRKGDCSDNDDDLEDFYFDNYSGDYEDFNTFIQLVKLVKINGDFTFEQVCAVVDNNREVYEEIVKEYTGLDIDAFDSLKNRDDDYEFFTKKFESWFYNESHNNGRIWTEDYIICMYDDADLTPGEMRRIITDLSKSSGIPVMTLMNFTYLRDQSFDTGEESVLSWTVRGFIHGEEPKVTKDENSPLRPSSDDDTETDDDGRPLHLQSPYEKWRKLKDFRRVRDAKIGKKLMQSNGQEMPLAQYRSMIYQESAYNKSIDNIVSETIDRFVDSIIKDKR